MKRTILLIAIATTTLLILPMALFAAPEDYLEAEGSSHSLVISKEAREGRFLRYQSEIDRIILESPLFGSDLDITPVAPSDAGEVAMIEDLNVPEDPIVTDPGGNDAGGTVIGSATDDEKEEAGRGLSLMDL